MKFKILLLIVCSFTAAIAQKKTVNITITYLQPYCGGARPTEEIQKAAETKKPYAEKTIVYVSGKNKIDSCKTDKQGVLKLRLKKGTYVLFEAWRYYLYTPENLAIDLFDKQCLKEEWQKSLYTVIVEKKNVKVTPRNPIVKVCAWNSPCLVNASAIPIPD